MAKQESTQRLVNELEEAVKTSKDLLKVMNNTNDVIVDMAKSLKEGFSTIDKNTSKGLLQFNKALKETNALTKDQEKLNQEIAKTERELIKNEELLANTRRKNSKEDESLRREKLKTVIIERKEQERLAVQDEKNRKAKEKLNSAYAKESKRLNDLRKKYKDLVVSEGKVTKESRKLLREIKKLDNELKDIDASAGQFQRKVGDYPDTMGKAAAAVKGLTLSLLTAGGAFKGVQTGLQANQEGSESLRKITSGLSSAWNSSINVAADFTLDLVDLGKTLVSSGEKSTSLVKTLGKIQNVFSRSSKSTDDFVDKLVDNAKATVEAETKTIDLEKRLRGLNEQVSILTGTFDKQNAIAGDSTRSFDEIEEAAEKAQNASISRAKINIDVAKEELSIIEDRIKATAEGSKNQGLLGRRSEARIKLTEAQNAVDVEQLELQKLLAENTRDRFERELDFAIDAFDTIKTVNERIIADERTSLETRRAILEETTALTDSSFESQKALFTQFVSDKIDFDKLVLESDEAVIRSTLRRLDLDDIELGRALEVIRERKIAIQDLIEANNDLVESEQERLDLQRDVEASDRAIVKRSLEATEELEEDRVDIQIKGIDERIENVEAGSVEELRLLKEKNDLILERQQTQLEKEAELKDKADEDQDKKDAERLQKRKELLESASSVFAEILSNARSKEANEIDSEITSLDKRIEQIKASGSTSTESLAQLEKERVLAEKKREDLRKKEIRDAKLIAGLNLLASNSDNPNAVGKTLSDVSILIAGLGAIQGFIDGTENVGDSMSGHKVHNGTDGYIAKFDGRERILNPEQNAKLGGISNEDLANLGQMYTNGMVGQNVVVSAGNNNAELIHEVKAMKKAIQSIPQTHYNYEANGAYHEQVIISKNRKDVNRQRANNIFNNPKKR